MLKIMQKCWYWIFISLSAIIHHYHTFYTSYFRFSICMNLSLKQTCNIIKCRYELIHYFYIWYNNECSIPSFHFPYYERINQLDECQINIDISDDQDSPSDTQNMNYYLFYLLFITPIVLSLNQRLPKIKKSIPKKHHKEESLLTRLVRGGFNTYMIFNPW